MQQNFKRYNTWLFKMLVYYFTFQQSQKTEATTCLLGRNEKCFDDTN